MEDKISDNGGIFAAASAYANVNLRLTQLLRVLETKGIISQEELENSMTLAEREHFVQATVNRFVEIAGKISREMGPPH